MASTTFTQAICIESCLTATIDFVIYGSLLAYFVCKAGKEKFGTNTIWMLLVPLFQYVICTFGRIMDLLRLN